MQRLRFRAMGCRMAAVSERNDGRIVQVPGWFRRWDRQLSRFRPTSDLSRLNAAGTRRVGPVLWSVIGASLAGARLTGGLVSPTLLPALEAAGYDRSWEQGAGPLRVAPAPDPAAWERIQVAPDRRIVRLPAGTQIDVGGFAKGWAADRAARRLGPGSLVDASGDITLRARLDGTPWSVAVSAIEHDQPPIALLHIRQGGIATSGRDVRRWRSGGGWQHHLIDPRTGQPAVTDIVRVTVIAPSAVAAEIAAKQVFLLGSEAGLDWIEQRPRLAALIVREDGAIHTSRGIDRYLVSGTLVASGSLTIA